MSHSSIGAAFSRLIASLTPVFLVVTSLTRLAAADRPIDIQRTITLHVGKAGLFSAAGHDHWVNALISSGTLNDSDIPQVEFRVDARKLEVMPDPKVDAKTQAEIQKNMQQMTLKSAQYPEITFRSTRVDRQAEGQWKVEGLLTVHGVTKPIVVNAQASDGIYVSHVVRKQSDFAIKPNTVGGGLIKVKNEVEIDFRIFARSE